MPLLDLTALLESHRLHHQTQMKASPSLHLFYVDLDVNSHSPSLVFSSLAPFQNRTLLCCTSKVSFGVISSVNI